jgi:uncharacterized membrane protein
MNPVYFLRACLGVGMTLSGIFRLRDPQIGVAEMGSLWLFTPVTEILIAIFELLGAPILLLGAKSLRNYYLAFYCVCIAVIATLYMRKHSLNEVPQLVAFTGDMKTIWYHILIATMMVAVIMAP